jgi:hypothetical protein
MNTLQAYADRLATLRNVLLLFGLFIAQSLINVSGLLPRLLGYSGKEGVYALDEALLRSPSDYQTTLTAWGAAGRTATIQAHVTFDILYPLTLAALLVLGNGLLWRRLRRPPQVWVALVAPPLLGCGFDLLENTGIVAMILRFPQQPGLFANLTSVCTLAKFSFDGLGGMMFLFGCVVWVRDRLRLSKRSIAVK